MAIGEVWPFNYFKAGLLSTCKDAHCRQILAIVLVLAGLALSIPGAIGTLTNIILRHHSWPFRIIVCSFKRRSQSWPSHISRFQPSCLFGRSCHLYLANESICPPWLLPRFPCLWSRVGGGPCSLDPHFKCMQETCKTSRSERRLACGGYSFPSF